jgi:hypothetical protein
MAGHDQRGTSERRQHRRDTDEPAPQDRVRTPPATATLLRLQGSAGNQAVLRALAHRELQRSAQTAVMNLGGEGSGDKRKRDDGQDGSSGTSIPGGKQTKQETVGDYTKDTEYETLDRWMHKSQKWHFTYFKASGDYHLKGNSGVATAYQKGFFAGQFKTITRKGNKNATANTILDGAAQYASCVTDIVPLYQALANYRGQQF